MSQPDNMKPCVLRSLPSPVAKPPRVLMCNLFSLLLITILLLLATFPPRTLQKPTLTLLPTSQSHTNPLKHSTPPHPPPTQCTTPTKKHTPPLTFNSRRHPPSLTQYAIQHARNRQCWQNPSCHPKPPALVWTCNSPTKCIGLGNRVRGIILSLLLAIASNRTLFVDDEGQRNEPFPLSVGMQPAIIDWRTPSAIRVALRRAGNARGDGAVGGSGCIIGLCHSSHGDVRMLRFRRREKCPSPLESCLWGGVTDGETTAEKGYFSFENGNFSSFAGKTTIVALSLSGRWNSLQHLQRNPHVTGRSNLIDLRAGRMEHLELARRLGGMLFQPSEAVEVMLRKEGLSLGGGYVGMHVRMADDVGERDLKRFTVGVRLSYDEAAGKLLRCVGHGSGDRGGQFSRETRVFLASDSMEMKRAMKRAVTTYNASLDAGSIPITLYTKMQRAVHISHMGDGKQSVADTVRRKENGGVPGKSNGTTRGEWREEDGDSTNRRNEGEMEQCRQFLNVFVDLFGLARARKIVMTGSTFAIAAYVLGMADNVKLVDVLKDGADCTPMDL